MIIDFKEIPLANSGAGDQDRFEQFTREFLESQGYEIIYPPARGADGKKDLIVRETRSGIAGGKTTIDWLVSCKHYAHSGKSVTDTAEPDILDRVSAHYCQGFMGVYSTIPANSLTDKLMGMKDKIESVLFDCTYIEKVLMQTREKDRILASYFPESYIRYQKMNLNNQAANQSEKEEEEQKKTSEPIPECTAADEETIFRTCMSAMIILELLKIKEEFGGRDWERKAEALEKLYRYSEHADERVINEVLQFLESVSNGTRAMMPVGIPLSIYSLILSYYNPYSYPDKKLAREHGKRCLHIGFNIAYDAFIYLRDFEAAQYGLLILKYVYREGAVKELEGLKEDTLEIYRELEQTLARPGDNELVYALELVKYFKDDLETKDLGIPPLPEHLYKRGSRGL